MKRYTFKRKLGGSYGISQMTNLDNYNNAIDKLGKIEDIEKKLEIDIINFYNHFGKDIYIINEGEVEKWKLTFIAVDESGLACNVAKKPYVWNLDAKDIYFTYEEAEKYLEKGRQ